MKNIINCIGILLLLVSCNQAIDSKEKDQQEDLISDSTTEVVEEIDTTDQEVDQDMLNIDYQKTLNQLKTDYQKNLDTGIGMLHTSKIYNRMTDSLVTLAYTDLLKRTPEIDKEGLMLEQKEWLNTRKKEFNLEYKKGEKIFKETGIFPELEEMVAYGVAADLNYKRASLLHEKLRNIK